MAFATSSDSSPTLVNVTLSGNVTFEGGGIWSSGTSHISMQNTIVWGNAGLDKFNEISNGDFGSVELVHSLFSNEPSDIREGGSFTVENSLNVDPLFIEADNGNLRLTDSSLAIDAGDPLTNPLIFPSDSDGNPIDLDGNPRFFPAVGEIDIGTYEWQSLGDAIFQDRFEN